MATKIKLQRLGKLREPHYRIVVADARTKRDGRYIEAIGQYHPKSNPSIMSVDADRAAYWLRVGAQPTETVVRILSVTGDWQKFKGLPAPPAMLVAPAKAVKSEVFAAAAKAAAGIEDKPATTARKAAPKKAAKPEPEAASAETPAAEVPVAEVPAAEAPAAEAPAAVAPEAPIEAATTDETQAD